MHSQVSQWVWKHEFYPVQVDVSLNVRGQSVPTRKNKIIKEETYRQIADNEHTDSCWGVRWSMYTRQSGDYAMLGDWTMKAIIATSLTHGMDKRMCFAEWLFFALSY